MMISIPRSKRPKTRFYLNLWHTDANIHLGHVTQIEYYLNRKIVTSVFGDDKYKTLSKEQKEIINVLYKDTIGMHVEKLRELVSTLNIVWKHV